MVNILLTPASPLSRWRWRMSNVERPVFVGFDGRFGRERSEWMQPAHLGTPAVARGTTFGTRSVVTSASS